MTRFCNKLTMFCNCAMSLGIKLLMLSKVLQRQSNELSDGSLILLFESVYHISEHTNSSLSIGNPMSFLMAA